MPAQRSRFILSFRFLPIRGGNGQAVLTRRGIGGFGEFRVDASRT